MTCKCKNYFSPTLKFHIVPNVKKMKKITHNKENIEKLRKLNKANEKEYSPHGGDPVGEGEGSWCSNNSMKLCSL